MRTALAATAASVCVLALAGCARQQAATVKTTEPAPVAARVLNLEPRPFAATVAVTGTLVSPARVEVKAETTGRLLRFDKEEGAWVAAGEVVAQANSEATRLSLRQAETGVTVAQAALDRARLIEQHSRTELDRARNLLKSGGITDKDLKAAELSERDARAQVAVAQAQLEQARAAIDLAHKQVRDSDIKSPISGQIQKKYATKGAYVEPATPVFQVVDNGRLELEAPVATIDLASVRNGQNVRFRVNSYPGTTFEGTIIETNPAVEADTRSAKVRIRVANSGGRLKAGMFAEGEILTGHEAQALIVPTDAVYRDDRSAKDCFVFVLDAGKAVKRAVRLGREHGTELEVAEGLKPGDQVIAEQNIQIAEGVRIEARK
jgi:RND family efflux transporter MFP subunit